MLHRGLRNYFVQSENGGEICFCFTPAMFTITLGPQYCSLPKFIQSSPENLLTQWNSLFYTELMQLYYDILRSKPDCHVYVYPPFPQLIPNEVLIPSFLRCHYQSNLKEVFVLGVYTEGCILEIPSPVFLSAVR